MKFNKSHAWYAFDMGNSAHALMVSSVGFALYFRHYLIADHPKPEFLWGILTAIVLIFSAIASPLLTSLFSNKNIRGKGLTVVTLLCTVSTALLATSISKDIFPAIIVYIISAITYYVALPIYNSYLPEISTDSMQRTSAKGWAWGYLGGIGVVVISLLLGLLDYPVAQRPELYRMIFVVAAIYNLAFSIPMLIVSWRLDSTHSTTEQSKWNFNDVLEVFREKPFILRPLLSYWLIGEGATIVVYFTAIFLVEYAGLSTAQVLKYTLVVQGGAFFSTWVFGYLADRVNAKKTFIVIIIIWIFVPFLLWAISKGYSIWYALTGISLVLGAYHSIIRAEIGHIVESIEKPISQGSLWGFLEVAGRISQILGPLTVGLMSYFVALNNAILVSSLFPLLALLVIRGYKWQTDVS